MKKAFIIISLLWCSCLKAQELKDTTTYAAGLRASQYMFSDTAGVQHSLDEFKGKYIYLDLWASWCYPCRKEYPFLRELEKSVNKKKIAVISISIDQHEYRWKGGMNGYAINEGIQWWAKDTTFATDFHIDRIPRFILLDKKGRVMQFSMTRPSSKETIKFLNNLK
ncbi:TlpA family protein disulfide reductase [Chitinophaga sancti]|uniref:Thiol-disulfide isomerase or thioredoxin n=1 Tax=Chitinophaga sancti TaxID=1004 RepID=A0A1K1SK55_9BACT|nr:TlpA disulfide reductase family protein [Chitinophaga sancti]WQD64503.1 TlpA disulfide reductase family protein [Chitinophaga sancti]WQG89873.1 TlpA disulfide reductase family protein [Chitinophaga sancti]SFW84548.1 Thiol-disulfide isomerase or thioredoxin [Chitinophaga sancti]